MIELEQSIIDLVVESHRPETHVHRAFVAGWQHHRDGGTRERIVLPFTDWTGDDLALYLYGWDARHRLSCAAAAGTIQEQR